MPLTKPDLWIFHIRLFNKTHETDHNERFNIRALSALGSPYLRTANTFSSLCVLLLTPSSELKPSSGITPTTPLP